MTPQNEDEYKEENYWSFEIIDGPSKPDLVLALFEGKTVNFELKKPSCGWLDGFPEMKKIEADITRVEAVSRHQSFELWQIDGFLPSVFGKEAPFIRFKGEFSTKTREGKFTFYDGKEVD